METVKMIVARMQLGMSISEHERAIVILYGTRAEAEMARNYTEVVCVGR